MEFLCSRNGRGKGVAERRGIAVQDGTTWSLAMMARGLGRNDGDEVSSCLDYGWGFWVPLSSCFWGWLSV
jgi:hypothetical protein